MHVGKHLLKVGLRGESLAMLLPRLVHVAVLEVHLHKAGNRVAQLVVLAGDRVGDIRLLPAVERCAPVLKLGNLVLHDEVLAVGVAVVLYFVLKPYVGTETVSWMCILGAAPFAAMGFVTYNGMTAEQFVWAWFRSEMLEPKQIKFEPVNIYYEALKDSIDAHEKEAYKSNDKEH